MSGVIGSTVSLVFPLDVEDDWPPVAAESMPFRVADEGYVALVPPFFVKDLSVGDVLEIRIDEERRVRSWRHVARSGRTTIWLLRMHTSATLDVVLAELKEHGCNTESFEEGGVYSVDVPDDLSIDTVDSTLSKLDTDAVAVAFPSMRHAEDV